MQQDPLFVEDIYEAMRVVVMAAGGTKKVGAELWPEKPADKAGELLANCLNRTRSEKLDPEQLQFLRRLGRRIGCHAMAVYENQDAGYAPPIPIEPEDERAQLQREFNEGTKRLERMLARMEQLKP